MGRRELEIRYKVMYNYGNQPVKWIRNDTLANTKARLTMIKGYTWPKAVFNVWTLNRFCFLSSYGKFDYELTYNLDMGVQNIDLYYDTEEQWYRAYGPRCAQQKDLRKKRNS